MIMGARIQTPEVEYLRDISRSPASLRALETGGFSHAQLLSMIESIKEQNAGLPGETVIRAHLGSLTQRQLEDFASRLRERLAEETTVLDPLHAEGLDPLARNLREIELPYDVEHISAETLQDINPFHREVGAFYRGGTIYVGPNLPGLRDRLVNLATRGIVSNDLFHEVYHGLQDGDVHYASLDDVLHSLLNLHPTEWKLALAEGHAWLCCLRGFKDEVLMPLIQTSYEIDDVGYLERAFKIVNGLNALGMSDRQVGELIGQTHWDDQTGEYAVLEPELRRMAGEKGHTEASLQEEIEKCKLIERIQALRAMGIAAEMCAN